MYKIISLWRSLSFGLYVDKRITDHLLRCPYSSGIDGFGFCLLLWPSQRTEIIFKKTMRWSIHVWRKRCHLHVHVTYTCNSSFLLWIIEIDTKGFPVLSQNVRKPERSQMNKIHSFLPQTFKIIINNVDTNLDTPTSCRSPLANDLRKFAYSSPLVESSLSSL